jgi:hypothetical protein
MSNNLRYYIGLFSVDSWQQFRRAGAQVMGFREGKAKAASRLQLGDVILCYLTKVSAFIGVMEVTGPSYQDQTLIWSDGLFPVRLSVRILTEVPFSLAVPIHRLRGKLSFLSADASGTGWTIHVRSSPRAWNRLDGENVRQAVEQASFQVQSPLVSAVEPSSPERKKMTLPASVRVGKLAARSNILSDRMESKRRGLIKNPLSYNKVTGYSVNFPIAETCRPSAVCMKTCYFASGPSSWAHAIKQQLNLFTAIKADPVAFAERVALEYDRLKLTFLRWNGGGDLFAESVAAINHLGRIRPDIVLWVVTRIPEWAARIEHNPNVYVHFSLDRYSLGRREECLTKKPLSQNLFFSYQADKQEIPPEENLHHISVLFFDTYKPTAPLDRFEKDLVCPLNGAADISGTCEWCRRCFNGDAVRHSAHS